MLERINTSQLGPVAGPYVHALRHRNTLYLSGLTADRIPPKHSQHHCSEPVATDGFQRNGHSYVAANDNSQNNI